MTRIDIIGRARELYADKNNIAYIYGAKGQICTDAVFESLWAAEPAYFAQYSAAEKAEIKRFSMGKRLYDCSGFINAISGQYNYSSGYWAGAKDKTTPAAGPDGNILYTTFGGTSRHIGIDIGHGFFMHCPKEGRTLEVGVIAAFPWEGSGRITEE